MKRFHAQNLVRLITATATSAALIAVAAVPIQASAYTKMLPNIPAADGPDSGLATPTSVPTHLPQAATTLYKDNWAGYAITDKPPYKNVKATWTMTAVNCINDNTSYDYTWVGLDGASKNSTTIEQAGTGAQCTDGTPSYFFWYETYPDKLTNYDFDPGLYPGQVVTAQASYANGKYTFAIKAGDGANYGGVVTKTEPNATAEVIEEAPSVSGSHPLPDFGTHAFSSIEFNDVYNWTSAPTDEYIMSDSGTDPIKAEPSALSTVNNETAFNINWKSYGP